MNGHGIAELARDFSFWQQKRPRVNLLTRGRFVFNRAYIATTSTTFFDTNDTNLTKIKDKIRVIRVIRVKTHKSYLNKNPRNPRSIRAIRVTIFTGNFYAFSQ